MKTLEITQYRNENGYIDLDKIPNLVIQNNSIKIEGRKPKQWIVFEDNKILFKETTPNSYEGYALLYFAEFLNQCGLEHAEYDLAILNNTMGVITPNFVKNNESLMSGESLFNLAKTIYYANGINSNLSNSVENIKEVLQLLNFEPSSIEKIVSQLIKLIIIDGLLLETDRNNTNYSFIIENNNIRLAPIYDGSNICGFNRSTNDIDSKIKNIKNFGTLHSIISNSKRSLFLDNITKEQIFIEEVRTIAKQYPQIIEEFLPKICNLNIDKATENIEKKIKNEVPHQAIIWINKILKYNTENILFACKLELEQINRNIKH